MDPAIIKTAILLVVAALILVASRPSFRARWPHALPRSMAFLLILILIILNSGSWLANPTSPRQLLSWVLLATSIPLAVYPLILLRRYGRPEGDIDHTTALVRRGIYRHIRHPLYLSLIVLALGSALKHPTPVTGTLTLTASALLYFTARLEEDFSLKKFGEPYADYMRQTKMFIPKVR
jgi:isoprenylcysteine carboxyl methyltransferase (ICMT) family protein YpbQ